MVLERLRDESYLAMKKLLTEALEGEFNYPRLEAMFNINRYYLWHIINTDGYKPPRRVARRLGLRRAKDLYSMPVKKLRWAIEHRTDIE
jgi:hypothetical protein